MPSEVKHQVGKAIEVPVFAVVDENNDAVFVAIDKDRAERVNRNSERFKVKNCILTIPEER